jgi:hypothetical protein
VLREQRPRTRSKCDDLNGGWRIGGEIQKG